MHRDAVNPVLTALLPIAIQVADEDAVADPAVKRLISAVRDWDLRGDPGAIPGGGRAAKRADALPRLRSKRDLRRWHGRSDELGAAFGCRFRARRRGARGEREKAYLLKWLQASAQGTPARGRGAAQVTTGPPV